MYPWNQNPPQTYDFLTSFDNNDNQASYQNPPQTYDFLTFFDNNVNQASYQYTPQTYDSHSLAFFDNNVNQSYVNQANYQNPSQTYDFLAGWGYNQPHVNQANYQQQQNASTELTLVADSDPWDMRKLLTASDTRSKIGLRLVSDFILNDVFPFWDADSVAKVKNGIPVTVWDSNTQSEYRIPFKRRTDGRRIDGYFFTRNWYTDFVARRNLNEGDEIGIYWDKYNSRFIFSVLN